MWKSNNKDKASKGNEDMSNESKVNTIIGEQAKVTGDIEQDGSIVIYGDVEGDIITKGTITVGNSGTIEGKLEAQNIKISGEVNGNIVAKTKMTLKDKSHLFGDIKAKQIVIEDGAKFEGKCDMGLDKDKKQSQKDNQKDKKDN